MGVGASPNPDGRRKLVGEIRDLARQYTELGDRGTREYCDSGQARSVARVGRDSVAGSRLGKTDGSCDGRERQSLVVHIMRFSDGEAGK
jgi:hypothetical protein